MRRSYKQTVILSIMLIISDTSFAEMVTITNKTELNTYLATQTDFSQSVLMQPTSPLQMSEGEVKAAELTVSDGIFRMIGNKSSIGGKQNTIIARTAEIDMEEKSCLKSFHNEDTKAPQSKIDIYGLVDIDGSGIRATSNADGTIYSVLNIKSGGTVFAEGTDDYIASRETNLEDGGKIIVKQNTLFNIVGDVTESSEGNPLVDTTAKQQQGIFNIKENGILKNDGDFYTNAVKLNNYGIIENGRAGTLTLNSEYNSVNGTIKNSGKIAFQNEVKLNKGIITADGDENAPVYGEVFAKSGQMELQNQSKIDADKISISGGDSPYLLTIDATSSISAQTLATLNKTRVELNGGRFDARIKATDTSININSPTSYIRQTVALDELNINTQTSVTQLFGVNSALKKINISPTGSLTLLSVAGEHPQNITVSDKITVYGKLIVSQSNDSSVQNGNKIPTTELSGGTLDVGANIYTSKVIIDEVKGGTINIKVQNKLPQISANNTENGQITELVGTTSGTNAKVNLQYSPTYTTAKDSLEKITLATKSLQNKVLISPNIFYKYYKDTQGTSLLENILTEKSFYIQKQSSQDIIEELLTNGLTINQANTIAGFTAASGTNESADKIAEDMANYIQNGDIQAAGRLANRVAPDTAPIIQSQITSVSEQLYQIVNNQHHSKQIGLSSGDIYGNKGGIWFQSFVNKNKLDNTFKSNSDGMVLGIEKYLYANHKLGAGYAYTDTTVKSYGHKDNIDTHTFFIYGEYKPSMWYVNMLGSYNQGRYNETKNETQKGKYDVTSISLQSMSGYEFMFSDFSLTPEIGLRYIYAHRESYTDTLSQYIHDDNMDFLTAVGGFKLQQEYQLSNHLLIRPQAHFQMTYDIKTDDGSTNVFLSNGAEYQLYGDSLDRFGMEFGGELETYLTDNLELSAKYIYRMREDYHEQTGMLTAKYLF